MYSFRPAMEGNQRRNKKANLFSSVPRIKMPVNVISSGIFDTTLMDGVDLLISTTLAAYPGRVNYHHGQKEAKAALWIG